MTIQQALKRGKWIRRKNARSKRWYRLLRDGWLSTGVPGEWDMRLTRAGILATDWEAKQ